MSPFQFVGREQEVRGAMRPTQLRARLLPTRYPSRVTPVPLVISPMIQALCFAALISFSA